MNDRSKSRSAARLAAVQALYQKDMENTPLPMLLHEFHQHRLASTMSWRASMRDGRRSTA
jgi:N utilization substance protein B